MTTDHELLSAVERCYENFAKAVDGESSMAYVITADLELVLDRLQSLLGGGWKPIDLSAVPKGKPVFVAGYYGNSSCLVYAVAEYYPENSLELRESYAGQLESDEAEYADAGWYRESTSDDEECCELGFEPVYFQPIEKPLPLKPTGEL